MSQSTTTAGSQGQDSLDSSVVYSQDQTLQTTHSGENPTINNFPDRQEDEGSSSQGSFVACSLETPYTQMSQAKGSTLESTQSISATPTPTAMPAVVPNVPNVNTVLQEQEKVKRDIARMNEEFAKHKYEAFVHKNMHLMFKVYPFDLK